jgi:hypothetical protein
MGGSSNILGRFFAQRGLILEARTPTTVILVVGYKRAQKDTVRTNGHKIGGQTKAQRHKIWAQKGASPQKVLVTQYCLAEVLLIIEWQRPNHIRTRARFT